MKELFCVKKSQHSRGSVLFRWCPKGKYLATTGQNKHVNIYERNGEQVSEFILNGAKPALQLEWDRDGVILAILQDGHSVVTLYNMLEKKSKELETNFKDVSFMCWSRTSSQLAIGTAKGNLFLYNSSTLKSAVIAGKHSKKITCGQWNSDNKLALAAQDKMMTISDEKGELLEQAKLKYDPYDIQFAEQKVDDREAMKENTISINMGHQTLLMYNLLDTENPVELAFQNKYGEIQRYHWFGDGYMMIGFSKGWVIAISTHMKEIGEELQSLKIHENILYDVVYSPALNKLATAGDDGVRVLDMSDWKEVKGEHREFNREEGDAEHMEWTKDGQILTVSTNGGYVFNFLMSIPVLASHYQSKLVYLSSLRHISILDVGSDTGPIVSMEVAIEPSFLALGPEHVAVGRNNHCWFYSWSTQSKKDGVTVHEREYLGTVSSICLNDTFAAVLCDGKINLHLIVHDASSDRDFKIFPEKDDNTEITSCCMTSDFLIYSTRKGSVHHFYLKDWAFVNEHRHDTAVTSIFTNPIGTRVAFIDNNGRGYLYSPVDDQKVEISQFPPSIENVLFDYSDHNTLIAIDSKVNRTINTYAYISQTVRGPVVNKVSMTKVPNGFNTVLLYDGQVHGQKASGQLSSVALTSHDAIIVKGRRNSDKLKQAFQQLLALNRLKACWDLALVLKSEDSWVALGRKALEHLDIDLAIRVYRELKETAMVLALQDIQYIEDKDLLAGHISLLNGDYTKAQTLFLSSSQPITALQMRRDLLHWDLSLKLASQLAPKEIPFICREYAAQLEVKGDYQQALSMYSKALVTEKGQVLSADHLKSANGGIARMTLRIGDLQRGRQLALQSGDKMLMKDCAQILENMKQYADAADMYVHAEQYEKAASIYNLTKNFAKAGPLMDKITTPKIHLQYAKAKEAEKDYATASIAYEKAKDMDSVIRLNLQYLDNPQKAFSIVRLTKSAEGAALVARYCQENGNFQAAIEFLLLAKKSEEAFQMAKDHKEMDKYAKALGEDGTIEEYTAIAQFYEDEKDYANAGRYYSKIGDYSRAMKLFLSCDTQHIDDAIQVVKKAQGQPGAEILVRQLHDFLIGETDGKVKDLNFIFRLYMAIGEYTQAANTAILIASQEQQCGQYATAHGILFAMHQDLIAQKLKIPNELKRNLLLLHSYTLAKKMGKIGDHDLAARMLIRVANNIGKFPAHVVPILTSTVVECQRAGLKKTSFQYASQLMQPQYRNSIDAKYRKPIEAFVRRPATDEADEKLSPCPFCSFELPETLLDCPSCKNNIPFCVSTGKHMLLNDWSECPSCRFPTLYSHFVQRINAGVDKSCWMCNQNIALTDIQLIADPKSKLFKPLEEEKQEQSKPIPLVAPGGPGSAKPNPLDIKVNL